MTGTARMGRSFFSLMDDFYRWYWIPCRLWVIKHLLSLLLPYLIRPDSIPTWVKHPKMIWIGFHTDFGYKTTHHLNTISPCPVTVWVRGDIGCSKKSLWNWTTSLHTFLVRMRLWELNLFFTHKTAFFGQNDTPLPNIHILVSLFFYLCVLSTGNSCLSWTWYW